MLFLFISLFFKWVASRAGHKLKCVLCSNFLKTRWGRWSSKLLVWWEGWFSLPLFNLLSIRWFLEYKVFSSQVSPHISPLFFSSLSFSRRYLLISNVSFGKIFFNVCSLGKIVFVFEGYVLYAVGSEGNKLYQFRIFGCPTTGECWLSLLSIL